MGVVDISAVDTYPRVEVCTLIFLGVTPTFFCKNKVFGANRSAYKNAYQIIVLVKNFPKINLA
jgi:hypothetical protein